MVKAYELGGTNVPCLIHIIAELDLPTLYPAPAFKVTITLYAWLKADALGLANASIWMTP